jgi:ornithine carbamoyltransferase
MPAALRLRPSPLDCLRPGEVAALVDSARRLQAAERQGALPQLLKGRDIGLLCDDHATTNAAAFQSAASALGAQVWYVPASDPSGIDGSDLVERARLLGRLYHAVECQGMPAGWVSRMAQVAGVPVFDHWGASDSPLAALADRMAVEGGGCPASAHLRALLQARLVAAIA